MSEGEFEDGQPPEDSGEQPTDEGGDGGEGQPVDDSGEQPTDEGGDGGEGQPVDDSGEQPTDEGGDSGEEQPVDDSGEQPTDEGGDSGEEQPLFGEAGEPSSQEEGVEVADAGVPSPEELDELDRSMTAARKEMGPMDDPDTAIAEADTTPSDVEPTSAA